MQSVFEQDSLLENRYTQELRRKAWETHLDEIKRYNTGKTSTYGAFGGLLGGIFGYIVSPFLGIFGMVASAFLGINGGVYVGHSAQFERTRKIIDDLEKTVNEAKTAFYDRMIPQPA